MTDNNAFFTITLTYFRQIYNIYKILNHQKARSSGGERCLDAAEVGGSKPPVPIESGRASWE